MTLHFSEDGRRVIDAEGDELPVALPERRPLHLPYLPTRGLLLCRAPQFSRCERG